MKIFTRLAIILSAVAAVVSGLFAVITAMLFYKQEALVQQGIGRYNSTIHGKVVVSKSRISPFENFPYISIDLKGVSVYETKTDTHAIIALKDIYVGFDLKRIIAGVFEVKKLKLKNGELFLRAYADGTYNLTNALKPLEVEQPDTTEVPFSLALKSMVIKDVEVTKTADADKTTLKAVLHQVKTSLSKDVSHVFAAVKGNASLSVSVKDSVYVNNKAVYLNTSLSFHKESQLLTIKPSELRLQGVAFSLSGKADIDDDMNLDLRIKGEKEDFSLLLTLLPDDMKAFMERYKNAGNIYFDAHISGKSINGNMPVVEANFGCKNGYFKNTNVNRTLDELSFAGYFTTGALRDLSQSEFRLLDFQARPEQGAVKARLILKNFKDPYVDLKVLTDFDLQFLSDFLQLQSLQNLKGKVLLDVDYDELVDINNPATTLQNVKKGVNSKLTVRDLEFKIPGYPLTLKNINASASMENGRLTLDSLSLKAGKSDLLVKGYLSSLPALLHNASTEVELGFALQSSLLDVYSLTNFDSSKLKPIRESITGLRTEFKFKGDPQHLKSFRYLPKGDFELKEFYAQLKNYPHTLHDFDVLLSITDEEIVVKKFDGEIDKTDFHLQAHVFNYPKWFKDKKDGVSKVDFNLNANHIYPANLLTYNGENYLPEEYRNEDIQQLRLKGDITLNYSDNAMKSFELNLRESKAKLTVHPLKIEDLSGKIHGEDGIIRTDNLKLKMGNSDLALSMNYHYGKKVKSKENRFVLKADYLDFDQLANYEKNKPASKTDMKAHEDSFNVFTLPFANNTVELDVKAMKYHRIQIQNFTGRLRMRENHFLYVDTLSMDIAGGHIDLSGYFNGSNPNEIYFSPNFTIKNIDLNQLLIKADNFGQEYVLNDNIKGQVTGTLKGKLRLYPDLFPVIRQSELEADVMLKNGTIVNFAPLLAVSNFFRDKNLRHVRFDTLQNVFTLRNNQLSFPAMTINSSLGFIEVSGRQSMDMNMDYTLRIPWSLVTNVGVNKLFGGRNKNEIPEDQIDDIIRRDETRKTRFIRVNISGTPENYKISLGKKRS